MGSAGTSTDSGAALVRLALLVAACSLVSLPSWAFAQDAAPVAESGSAPATSPVPIAVATAADSLPANLVATSPDSPNSNTAEISAPAAQRKDDSESAAGGNIDEAARTEYNPDIARYEAEQHGVVDPRQSQMLMQILQQEAFESTIGFELEETQRKLSSGERADGLLVVSVDPGSPADTAGLHPMVRTGRNVMVGAAIAAAMFAPPLIFAVPAIDYAEIGQKYDMIIGVDGERVTSLLDFQSRLRDLQPGEIIYLSVVRNGVRRQIQVKIPKGVALTK